MRRLRFALLISLPAFGWLCWILFPGQDLTEGAYRIPQLQRSHPVATRKRPHDLVEGVRQATSTSARTVEPAIEGIPVAEGSTGDEGKLITGVVLDPDGEPVPGALVVASHEDGGRGSFPDGEDSFADRARTDDHGRFRLNLRSGPFRLRAEAEGFAGARLRDVPAGSEGIELWLHPGRTLSGRILDPDGQPIAGVALSVYTECGERSPRDRSPWSIRRLTSAPRASGESDAWGSFRFTLLPPGDLTVVAEKDSWVTSAVSTRIDADETEKCVEIEMARGRSISGRVTTPDGEGVGGAHVTVARYQGSEWESSQRSPESESAAWETTERRQEHGPIPLLRAERATETDEEGFFTFTTLEERRYVLSVQAEGFVPRRTEAVDLTKIESSDIDVVVERGVLLAGLVTSSVDRKPVPGAGVFLRWGEDRRGVVTDEDGRFESGGLAAVRLDELRVEAKGFGILFLDDLELESEPPVQMIELTLEPAASIRGSVVDGSGHGVPGARVRVHPVRRSEEKSRIDWRDPRDRERRYRDERRRRAHSVSATTDGAGRFFLEEVNPGEALRIEVEHGDFEDFESDSFALAPGESMEGLRLELSAGARLMISVFDAGGLSLPGALVRLQQRSPETEEGRGERPRGRVYTRVSDPDGEAAFGGVEAGEYLLSTAVEGHRPFSTFVHLREDRETPFVIRLAAEAAGR